MHQDIWDDRIGFEDGEWITWSDVDHRDRDEARHSLYAKGDRSAIQWFEALLTLAHDYHEETGGHLEVYGEIGELFAAAAFGIRRHGNRYAKGSDGRLGNDFVEVKTITPFKGNDTVEIRRDRNFSKVLIVRIDADFSISGRLVERRLLSIGGKKKKISWDWLEQLRHENHGPAGPEVWNSYI